MGDWLDSLLRFFSVLRDADSELRDNSLVGETPFERKSRKTFGCLVGAFTVLLILLGIAWATFVKWG